MDFHRSPLVGWGLVIDVSVNIHIDIDANWVGLLFHDVAKEASTSGQKGDSPHHTKGKAKISKDCPADTGTVERQMLAKDL